MKFLKKFKTKDGYQTYADGPEYIEPHVSLITEMGGGINYNKPSIPNNEIWYWTSDGFSAETANSSGITSLQAMGLKSNEYIDGKGVMKFDKNVTSIDNHAFNGCSGLTSIVIPNSVTGIGEYAFYGCKSLASITIPDSVTSIGQSAFASCSKLTSVTIPDSVTYIGDYAFHGCTSLASITIPDSVTSIGQSAFNGCSNLNNVTIPDSVTSIGNSVFNGCKSLTSITIPDSVTEIGGQAFYRCTNLTSITYTSTQSQWSEITKGSGWKSGVPATCMIHCTDGDINI